MTSNGILEVSGTQETHSTLRIRALVSGLQVKDPSNVLFPNLSAVELSIETETWANALATGKADGLEPIHAQGTAVLRSGAAQAASGAIECALYGGELSQDYFQSDRAISCWLEPSSSLPDSPIFTFVYMRNAGA